MDLIDLTKEEDSSDGDDSDVEVAARPIVQSQLVIILVVFTVSISRHNFEC